MKKLKNYKLFLESLQDDFNNTIKNLNGDKVNSGYQADKFVKALSDVKSKQEFMYRVSDGEDVIDLIEEFVDKCQLSDEDQFGFRATVMAIRLDEIKTKYEEGDRKAGTELVMIAANDGVDKTMKYLTEQMEKRPEITPDRVIDLIQVAVDWLQENDVLINWTYQRDQNANAKKIEAGKILMDRLREFTGEY
jgi:hemerythrin-like domain-containing protein